MLLSKKPVPIPSRSLLVELISRNGSPNTESLSPYEGRAGELHKHFADYDARMVASFLATQVDYSAANQRPQPGPYVKSVGQPKEYLTKLEEIDASWIYKYLENKLLGLNIQAKGGIREFKDENQATRIFVDSDGREMDESDMLTEYEDEYTGQEISEARDKLPHILKRLHVRSKEMRVHLLSIVIAYEKAKSVYNTPNPSPANIIDCGVWDMDASGHVTRKFTIADNNGRVFPKASKWVRGYEEFYDSYFDNAMELLDCCDKLGIDITKEDPLEFQEEYISTLVVTYIAKNKDYVSAKGRSLNSTVYSALRTMPLEAYDADITPPKVRTGMDLIPDTIQVFQDADFNWNKDDICEHACAQFITFYNYLMQTHIDMSKLVTVNGFFYLNRSVPCLFDVTKYCEYQLKYPYALMHISGLLILLTDDNRFYYQDVYVLTEYINDLINGRAHEARYRNNTKFGRWESELV